MHSCRSRASYNWTLSYHSFKYLAVISWRRIPRIHTVLVISGLKERLDAQELIIHQGARSLPRWINMQEMVKQLKDNVVGSNTHEARSGAQMFWITTGVYELGSTHLLLQSLVDSQVHSCNQSQMIRRRKPEPATIYNNDKNNVQTKARFHFSAKFKYSQV